MKAFFLVFFFPLSVFSQVFNTKEEAAKNIANDVFTTSKGRQFKKGDTLVIAKGSMPDKSFSFILMKPKVSTGVNDIKYLEKMPAIYRNKNALINDFLVAGNKKSGFYIIGLLDIGTTNKYLVEFESAIDFGEL